MAQAETDDLAIAQLALLENVGKLTKPYVETVEQEQHGKTKTIKITHPPLLDQLDQAILSNQTTVKRGGSLASQRNVLDASAYMLQDALFQEMYSMWTRHIHAPMPQNLTHALKTWHVQIRKLTMDGRMKNDTLWRYARRTSSWIAQIETKFDPPVTLEVTRPCPRCNNQYVYNDTNERVAAVVIVWQKSFDKSNALCRSCGQHWYGERELRQLRYDIDQRDTSGWDVIE